jgi:hypothetical protein
MQDVQKALLLDVWIRGLRGYLLPQGGQPAVAGGRRGGKEAVEHRKELCARRLVGGQQIITDNNDIYFKQI